MERSPELSQEHISEHTLREVLSYFGQHALGKSLEKKISALLEADPEIDQENNDHLIQLFSKVQAINKILGLV